MEVIAKRNITYGGKIYSRGESFECDEKFLSSMKSRGLIETAEMSLPSLEEEIKRKKNSA